MLRCMCNTSTLELHLRVQTSIQQQSSALCRPTLWTSLTSALRNNTLSNGHIRAADEDMFSDGDEHRLTPLCRFCRFWRRPQMW